MGIEAEREIVPFTGEQHALLALYGGRTTPLPYRTFIHSSECQSRFWLILIFSFFFNFFDKAISRNMARFVSFLGSTFLTFQCCKKVNPHLLCNLAAVEKVYNLFKTVMLHQKYKLFPWERPSTSVGFFEVVCIGHYTLPCLWVTNQTFQAVHHSHYSMVFKSEQKFYYSHTESFWERIKFIQCV